MVGTRPATYRGSSAFNETAFASDGDNRSIWRMNPRRMDVETWRDSLLAVTGELDAALGGPSILLIHIHRNGSLREGRGSDRYDDQ